MYLIGVPHQNIVILLMKEITLLVVLHSTVRSLHVSQWLDQRNTVLLHILHHWGNMLLPALHVRCNVLLCILHERHAALV